MNAPERPTIPADLIHAALLDCSGKCHQPAAFVAQIHLVDYCTTGKDLTPDGNMISIYCADCLRDVAKFLHGELQRRLGRLPNGVNFCICETRQRPISTLHDVLETETL